MEPASIANPVGATVVACPACQSPATQPCTAPTETGRRYVTWVHLSRDTAAKEVQR